MEEEDLNTPAGIKRYLRNYLRLEVERLNNGRDEPIKVARIRMKVKVPPKQNAEWMIEMYRPSFQSAPRAYKESDSEFLRSMILGIKISKDEWAHHT
jgi:hypothetical protein